MSRVIDEPEEKVWIALSDLESHQNWMKDARSIVFDSDHTSGPGTVMRVETRIGPFRTMDVIEVTNWVEGESIDVVHRGVVQGNGSLSIRPRGQTTEVAWTEELFFPWWLGGRLGAWLARPVLAAVWRGNLSRLEESLTSL